MSIFGPFLQCIFAMHYNLHTCVLNIWENLLMLVPLCLSSVCPSSHRSSLSFWTIFECTNSIHHLHIPLSVSILRSHCVMAPEHHFEKVWPARMTGHRLTFIFASSASMAAASSWTCLAISCLPSFSPFTTSLKRSMCFFKFRTFTIPSMLKQKRKVQT